MEFRHQWRFWCVAFHRARSWVHYFLFCIQQKSRQLWKVLGFTRIPMPTTSRFMPTQIRRRRIHSWRHFPTVSMPSRSGWQATVYGSIRTRRKLSGLVLHVASTIARWRPWSSLAQRSPHPPKFAILVSCWTATYRWRHMSINWSVCVSFTYASYDWCDVLWLSIRHTLWCVQWYTAASIIVTAYLLDLQLRRSDVCSPFWNLQLDSSCCFLVMRVSRTAWKNSCTGSLSHSE